MSAKSNIKKQCQAVASNTGNQCQKPPVNGTSYCWSHMPKKESLVIMIIGVLVGAVLQWLFTMGWDAIKIHQAENKLQSQIEASLRFEFQDNQTCWEKNYTIVTQDRGALQQEKTEKFLKDNLLWITYRPLCDFSFRAWEYAITNTPDLPSRLNEDGYMLLKEFYGALREIQDYKNEREKHREIKEKNMENSKIFEDVNQNLISSMSKHQVLSERVRQYFYSQLKTSQQRFPLNANEGHVVITEVSGDTAVATGDSVMAVDTRNIASGITVDIDFNHVNTNLIKGLTVDEEK